ncbi:uncharacterized protein LOC135474849 [Liolophura sinensis]|uniref:uncharacterized protein LOC135474849 n=1 Tax=Liolophura sinensis TaxID=3198878 RepID=UPI00315824F2
MDLTGDYNLPYAFSICFIVMLLFFVAEGSESQNQKRCTQIVKEERVRYVLKKISVTRKIPARCSSWDRDWAWLTNKDCSDKYRVEYMNDKRQVKFTTYRTEQVCCPNENGSWCNISVADSRRPGEPGYTTETHTLLTVLLPVVATLAFIFIVSISIIAYVIIRQKRRRAGNGTTAGKHSYESVKGNDSKKGNAKSGQSGKEKLGYEAVSGQEKGEGCAHGEIPYSVEVVDGGPERLALTTELLGLPHPQPVDLGDTPVTAVECTDNTTALDRFKDIDKETAIDNALLYDILIEGQNNSGSQPTAPSLDQFAT